MAAESIRAFTNDEYDYYRLTQDFGLLKRGTIFYHDPYDNVYGSIAKGCLKNCWTPDGNCYGELAGGTVILHYDFVNTDLFKAVELVDLGDLLPGKYELIVHADGDYELQKKGNMS